MKKLLIFILVGVLMFSVSAVALANNPIKILIDFVEVKSDVAPVIQNGRVLVPLRVIAERLNYNVRWDATDNTVHIGTPQSNFKGYYDKQDFVNDFKMALQCLEEINFNLTEAWLHNDPLHSGSHVLRARGFLSQAKDFESYLAKYKDAAGLSAEYQELVTITSIYSNVLSEKFEQQFPVTQHNLDYFDKLSRQKGNAYIKLLDLEDKMKSGG